MLYKCHNVPPRIGLFLCLVFTLPIAVRAQDKKLTPDEVVARHLEAIGSKEARTGATRRLVNGRVKYVIRLGGGGFLDGAAMMLSSASKVRYTMKFSNSEYPVEEMAFDGQRSESGFLPSGGRTPLSTFLNQQGLPLKEGLFGGVLSTAWPLGRIEELQPRLEYRGLKKIDGREMYSLGYRPRKGSTDLKVTLYFDSATFRHVRTEYKFEIGARLGQGPNDSTRVQETYYVLSEEFDDFRSIDGLTLPYKYKLQYSVTSSGGSLLRDWSLAVDQISHQTAADEGLFKLGK